MTMWTILLLLASTWSSSWGQVINRAPHFIQGGDMARLAVSEGALPGAPVYTLRGEDPEESKLHYSISGEYFTVNRETGVVILRKALDRETQDLIEVIISITGKLACIICRIIKLYIIICSFGFYIFQKSKLKKFAVYFLMYLY